MEGLKGGGGSSDDNGSDGDDASLPCGSNGKKRKSPSGAEKRPSSAASGAPGPVPGSNSDKGAPRKSKKVREEVEDLHAETQRLLRETSGTSFAPEQVMQKPVSSLIEKIRQRKLQLSGSVPKGSTSTLRSTPLFTLEQGDVLDECTVDDDIEFVMYKPPIRLVVKQEPGEASTSGFPRDEPDETPVPMDDTDESGDGDSSQPSTPDIRLDRSNSNSGYKSPPKSFLRAPLVESQDLYTDSQLSLKDESPVPGDDEDILPVVGIRMNLHLDSETQGDDRWLEDDVEKENRAPIAITPLEHIPIVADVRGLIDDEAEDEDEDDSSLEDEDEEGRGTTVELQGLLTQDAGEELADIERRAELHSKWLEQQDLAMEDNILHRIETGWKSKGKKDIPALLSETQDRVTEGYDVARPFGGIERLREASGDFRSSLEALENQVKDDDGLLKRATSSGYRDQDEADAVHRDDFQESSDDEEAEENLRRQLFLQESEEKIEFLSVTDDESSREIFSLISKVNVAAIKPRTATAHNEARTSVTGYHHPPALEHQSSFLRRKVTTVSATTRQGSGSSRSYVFGRDDSNSRDASQHDNRQQTGKAKMSEEPKLNATSKSTQWSASSNSKTILQKETRPRGPSLFQVLKQQAAELASGKSPFDLSRSSSKGDNLSIFTAMKPSRQPRGSRGT